MASKAFRPPTRRLAHLSIAISAMPTVFPGPDPAAPRFRAGTANGLGVTVEQDPQTGAVSVQALQPVVKLKNAAVEAEDYARAAHLQQIIKVLHPNNKMTPVSI